MKKAYLSILLLALSLASCGKKGPLVSPGSAMQVSQVPSDILGSSDIASPTQTNQCTAALNAQVSLESDRRYYLTNEPVKFFISASGCQNRYQVEIDGAKYTFASGFAWAKTYPAGARQEQFVVKALGTNEEILASIQLTTPFFDVQVPLPSPTSSPLPTSTPSVAAPTCKMEAVLGSNYQGSSIPVRLGIQGAFTEVYVNGVKVQNFSSIPINKNGAGEFVATALVVGPGGVGNCEFKFKPTSTSCNGKFLLNANGYIVDLTLAPRGTDGSFSGTFETHPAAVEKTYVDGYCRSGKIQFRRYLTNGQLQDYNGQITNAANGILMQGTFTYLNGTYGFTISKPLTPQGD